MPSIKLKFWESSSRQKDANGNTSSSPETVEPFPDNRRERGLVMLFPNSHLQPLKGESEASVEPEAEFAIDIIAVHGVNGDAHGTWSHKNGKLWLRDFLPNQIPGARIFSFGYNSKVALSLSFGEIEDWARSLLTSLELERPTEKEKSRKIMFLCHSMGGIVVKKALILANEERSYSGNILDSTRAILFFATPHGGSGAANFPQVLANIANASLSLFRLKSPGRFRTEVLEGLRKDSKVLEEVSSSFRHRAIGLRIVSFYEQPVTEPFGIKIVEKGSAIIGISNEEVIPLDADHREICRFDSEENPLYITALQKIKQVAKEIEAESVQYAPCDSVSHNLALSEEEKKCLQCLYSLDYESYKLNIPPRVNGTCTWFLEHEKFKTWQASTRRQSSLLWVSGGPGCGKTVLASFLVDHLRSAESQREYPATVCYLFCGDKAQGQVNANTMLSRLLHQIFSKHPSAIKHITSEFQKKGPSIAKEFATLWNTLMTITMSDGGPQANIVCIIDALDECDEPALKQLLRELGSYFISSDTPLATAYGLKFLITSRLSIHIGDSFRKFQNIRLWEDGEADHISKDIALVVAARVDNAIHWPETPRTKIRKFLTINAGRTFLWVSPVLKAIEQSLETSEEALEHLLTDLPDELTHFYDNVLKNIQEKHQDEVKKILKIIVSAVRPLTLQELGTALSIRSTDSSLEDVRPRINLDTWRYLQGVCGPLLRVAGDSTVHLVHQTAKKFLTRGVLNEVSWDYSIGLPESNLQLASICLWYLLFSEFKNHPSESEDRRISILSSHDPLIHQKNNPALDQECQKCLKKYDFLDYAIIHWLAHFRGSHGDAVEPTVLRALTNFFGSPHLTTLLHFYQRSFHDKLRGIPHRVTSKMILASFFGLSDLVRLFLEEDAVKVDLSDTKGRTPLSWAAERGHEGVIRLLLDHGAMVYSTDDRGRTPLSYATEYDNVKIVKLLLEYGAKAETPSNEAQKPPL